MREFEPIHVEGWCGVEALQYVIEEENMWFSQPDLARILGTTHENGTSHEQMIEGARKIGLQCEGFSNIPTLILPILSETNYIIVNWMDGPNEKDDGHYSVFYSTDGRKITLMDRTMPVQEFEKKWYDITPEGRVDHWAMLVKRTI